GMTTAYDPAAEPYEDSRRLTGCNVYFAGTGAALEATPGLAVDDAALARWCDNVATARRALGWADGETIARRHRSGVSLAFAAPLDCLYAATEVNEWAWWAALFSNESGAAAEGAFPPPLQGEGRGGDGVPVGRGDLQPGPVRGDNHPHPNPPLEGEGFKAGQGFEALLHAPGHAAV